MMGAVIRKRSIILDGRKTSISLEESFWQELNGMARRQGISVNDLVHEIDGARTTTNLSSSVRLAIFADLKNRLSA